ncbi:glycosyltransferase [Amycolatopsis regifaucium]|uniref:Glycosyl transferase n=1 Tax=Amycolatopsis regifaucium TaxID=546365 RepID=A0A154M3W5_9PSEU|nr:glycosyltransferase family 2 protein [Amycolatopsis regifaucium]KZB79292.1 hypothetical protein AVL48_17010 [Amycolatopsis regifaucium]OKA07474.1 hypothetical protein ATP06_0216695 [Amycolatopsis regifaucium]SFH10698.1 Glycosyltransferase, catalytic subunit of cellulose synthase and poly-beta-1,6-N-acetylglucosamine synthase [Amycolatopsis regifaucium]
MARPGARLVHLTARLGAVAFTIGFGYAALARVGVLLPALRSVHKRHSRPVDPGGAPDGHAVTFLVPARQEHSTIGRALRSMLACRPGDGGVVAVVDSDDPRTITAAEGAHDGSGRLRVLHDASPGGKGAALTAALTVIDTEIVGVFDADSVVRPGLLPPVRQAFADGADVVQVPVRPCWNRPAAWHGTRTLLDYAAWSSGRAGTTTGVVRLSGTGVFFRTSLLRAVGGWRPSLTEDFDLALRLTAAGARITVVDRPDLATDEQVPHSASSLLRQRIRWHQGFLEILATGVWWRMPTTRMRMSAVGPLLVPVGRALAAVAAVPTLAAVLAAGSAPLTLLVPAGLSCLVLAIDVAVFVRLAPSYGVRPSLARLVALVLGAVPFYTVSATASTLAVVRQLTGQHDWETTEHAASE